MLQAELKELYTNIASGMANHLLNSQVLCKNTTLDFSKEQTIQTDSKLLRKSKRIMIVGRRRHSF